MTKILNKQIPIGYLYATVAACICFGVGFVEGYSGVFC